MSNVVQDLLFPPAFSAFVMTVFLLKPGVDWRLDSYGYSLLDKVELWASGTAFLTAFVYAGIFLKYSDWLFANEPAATWIGIILLGSVSGWVWMLFQRHQAAANQKLYSELSTLSEVPVPTRVVQSTPSRIWALTNVVAVVGYALWIARIVSKY